jgi:hypothetical protein
MKSARISGLVIALGALIQTVSAGSADGTREFKYLENLLIRAGRFDFDAHVITHGAIESDLTTKLGVANAGIVALRMKGTIDGEQQNANLRSDGIVTMLTRDDRVERLQPGNKMRQAVELGFVRVGLAHNLLLLSLGQQPERDHGGIEQWTTAANIRSAEVQRDGQTKIIFDVMIEGKKRGNAALWIDNTTKFPVRREQSITIDGKKIDSIEDYSNFAVTS